MRVLGWSALVIASILLSMVVLKELGRLRWEKATQSLVHQLEAGGADLSRGRVLNFHASELVGLPIPVQRYFLAVLQEGQKIVRSVTVRHTGTFNVTGLGKHERWMPFTSEQNVVTTRPGFVWNARMEVFPGVNILVHDAYVGGVGTLHPSVMGLIALTHQTGTGDIARGELMRYMMEAAWYPTALLPSQGTQWHAVDAVSADATMVDGDIQLTMRFTFGVDGLIESARADGRGAMVGGKMVMLPWGGNMSNYQERGGMRVPLTAEAAWLPPGSRKPYWRGTIGAVEYKWAS
jgi:hypothetical protein